MQAVHTELGKGRPAPHSGIKEQRGKCKRTNRKSVHWNILMAFFFFSFQEMVSKAIHHRAIVLDLEGGLPKPLAWGHFDEGSGSEGKNKMISCESKRPV